MCVFLSASFFGVLFRCCLFYVVLFLDNFLACLNTVQYRLCGVGSKLAGVVCKYICMNVVCSFNGPE